MSEIKIIALLMGGSVHGTYIKMERENADPKRVMEYMLDVWNNEGNDGRDKLVDILNDKSVKQSALARKIAASSSQKEKEKTGASTSNRQTPRGQWKEGQIQNFR